MIDSVGVGDNPAGRRLAENPFQSDHGEDAAFDDVPQDISGADGRQLVHVSHQDQPHRVGYGPEQGVHQDDVHHGALVRNEDVALKRMILIALIAFRRLEFQQAVNGFCFHAGDF